MALQHSSRSGSTWFHSVKIALFILPSLLFMQNAKAQTVQDFEVIRAIQIRDHSWESCVTDSDKGRVDFTFDQKILISAHSNLLITYNCAKALLVDKSRLDVWYQPNQANFMDLSRRVQKASKQFYTKGSCAQFEAKIRQAS